VREERLWHPLSRFHGWLSRFHLWIWMNEELIVIGALSVLVIGAIGLIVVSGHTPVPPQSPFDRAPVVQPENMPVPGPTSHPQPAELPAH
jgi:ABC-type phosphate transport system auxiliary subunit